MMSDQPRNTIEHTMKTRISSPPSRLANTTSSSAALDSHRLPHPNPNPHFLGRNDLWVSVTLFLTLSGKMSKTYVHIHGDHAECGPLNPT